MTKYFAHHTYAIVLTLDEYVRRIYDATHEEGVANLDECELESHVYESGAILLESLNCAGVEIVIEDVLEDAACGSAILKRLRSDGNAYAPNHGDASPIVLFPIPSSCSPFHMDYLNTVDMIEAIVDEYPELDASCDHHVDTRWLQGRLAEIYYVTHD